MKNMIYLIFGLVGLMGYTQDSEEALVRQAVDDFFEGFHSQDSMQMKKLIHSDIVLRTIGETKEGTIQLVNEDIQVFFKTIVSIPDSVQFQERLLDYNIQLDGPMANVWTPYEFWLNGEFHHCGVNSFQLLKEADSWKIIYLIDTRRKLGCLGKTE